MECLQCMGRLSEYLDGELSSNEYRVMQAHMEFCPDCQTVFSELAALREKVKQSIDHTPVPANLSERILLTIQKEQQKATHDLWLTGILLIIFTSPLLLFFSRTFISLFRLGCTTSAVFWRSLITLEAVSPWVTVAIVLLSLLVMVLGGYMMKTLLMEFEGKEVYL